MTKSMRRRRWSDPRGVGTVVTAVALSGCGDVELHAPEWKWDGDFREVHNTEFSAEETFTYDVAATAALTLTGIAGSVEIVGTPTGTSTVIEGVRRVRSETVADARRHLDELGVDVSTVRNDIRVETRQPHRNLGRAYEVEYRITVPEGTDVTILHVSGPVHLSSLRGDIRVDAVAGRVTFEDVEANVRASVSAGEIRASLVLPVDGTVDLVNGAGDITLSIPSLTSARLHAATVAGGVRVLGLDLSDEDPSPRACRGTLAGGRGTIRLKTVVGDITLEGSPHAEGG